MLYNRIYKKQKKEWCVSMIKRKKKVVLVCCLVLATILVAIPILYFSTVNLRAYNSAVQLYENENFAEALEAFENLNDYRDSAERIRSCNYNLALLMLSNNDYFNALQIFEHLGDYLDSISMAKECKYNLALIHIESGELEEAILLLERLGNHNDTESLLQHIVREKGMRENADYDFLNAIEDSINSRQDAIEQDDGLDRARLVRIEQNRLSQFRDLNFYDERLEALANDYLDGLDKQEESLNMEYPHERNIMWQEGMVMRFEALEKLYNEFNIFSNCNSFVDDYISDLENQRRILQQLNDINDDLQHQVDNDEIVFELKDDWTGILRFTNNTEHSYDIIVHFSFFSEDLVDGEASGIRVFDSFGSMSNVRPNSTFNIEFSLPSQFMSLEFAAEYWPIN